MLKKFRFHYSTREFYQMDFLAESLEAAIEDLLYSGVGFQTEDKSGFLIDANIDSEEEEYTKKEQWEIIDEDN